MKIIKAFTEGQKVPLKAKFLYAERCNGMSHILYFYYEIPETGKKPARRSMA